MPIDIEKHNAAVREIEGKRDTLREAAKLSDIALCAMKPEIPKLHFSKGEMQFFISSDTFSRFICNEATARRYRGGCTFRFDPCEEPIERFRDLAACIIVATGPITEEELAQVVNE